MSRLYTIQTQNASVTTSEDILTAYVGAARVLRCRGIEMGANGQTSIGNYPIRLKYLPSVVTLGSGGTTVTPNPVDPLDSPAGFSAAANNPSAAISTGTVTIFASQFNPINGYYWQPPSDRAAPVANIGGAFVLSLDVPPSPLGLSATMYLEEL